MDWYWIPVVHIRITDASFTIHIRHITAISAYQVWINAHSPGQVARSIVNNRVPTLNNSTHHIYIYWSLLSMYLIVVSRVTFCHQLDKLLHHTILNVIWDILDNRCNWATIRSIYIINNTYTYEGLDYICVINPELYEKTQDSPIIDYKMHILNP